MAKFLRITTLWLWGGAIYTIIEVLWRGHTHWTMFVLGGVCFLSIGAINEFFSWNMPLVVQGLIGAVQVTALELCAGVILNLWLRLGIWDYSHIPFNLWGQICLPFTAVWFALSVFAVVLDDWLRYWLFKEERPHYTIFKIGGR